MSMFVAPVSFWRQNQSWSAGQANANAQFFGDDGPSASGGFQFVTGSKLTDAFNLAMLAEKSNGSAIDTVSVTGNTLTASTSGSDAHPVFTVTLHPNSGLWTFTLVNPIDGV